MPLLQALAPPACPPWPHLLQRHARHRKLGVGALIALHLLRLVTQAALLLALHPLLLAAAAAAPVVVGARAVPLRGAAAVAVAAAGAGRAAAAAAAPAAPVALAVALAIVVVAGAPAAAALAAQQLRQPAARVLALGAARAAGPAGQEGCEQLRPDRC